MTDAITAILAQPAQTLQRLQELEQELDSVRGLLLSALDGARRDGSALLYLGVDGVERSAAAEIVAYLQAVTR